MTRPKVALIGLGAMGGGMGRHLLKNGFSVTGYDVYPPSVDRFVADGGLGSNTPEGAVAKADIVLIMVTSGAQVNSVLFDPETGAARVLKPGAAIIVSSTVPPSFYADVTKKLEDDFARKDVYLLDCPVSGGTPRAADGTLSIFSSGPDQGLAVAEPVLSALSARLYKIPGGVGFGSKAKMCHQVLPEVHIALAAEVFALAARAGLNTQQVFDAVQASDGASWIIGNRVQHMLDGDTRIYSAVVNSQKDSVSVKPPFPLDTQHADHDVSAVFWGLYFNQSIITSTSLSIGFPVFLVSTAEQVYTACIHAGWAKDDDATIQRLYLGDHPADLIHQQTKTPGVVPRVESITIDDIIDIFTGVHLAVSSEALGFTEATGLDTDVIYDIISQAAGSNAQFVKRVPEMKKPTWSLRDVASAPDVGHKLVRNMSTTHLAGSVFLSFGLLRRN